MKKMVFICIAILLTITYCGKKPEPTEPELDKKEIGPPPEGMVLIPGGSFTMGTDKEDEGPPHKVHIESFYLDKHEITNQEYKEFIEATGHPKPRYLKKSDFNNPNQPVVGISYYDALSYAQWAGKRLPTEAEWEYAARGGLVGKKFPWGDEQPFSRCNYAPKGRKEADGFKYTSPVGSFKPNQYGLYDMSGNVWEWCADAYSTDYYRKSPENNPAGPDSGYTHVLRGGSWLSINPKHLTCTSRLELKPFVRDRYYGFRCAKTP